MVSVKGPGEMKIKQILMFGAALVASAAFAQQDEKPITPQVVISQDVADKLLAKRVEPDYPADAKALHVAGQVVISMVIDKEGNVIQAFPVAQDLANRKSMNADDARLRNAAVSAVKQWKYRPYRRPSGALTEVGTSVVLQFDFTGSQAPAVQASRPGIPYVPPNTAEEHKIHSEYPQMAGLGNIEGDVVLEVFITEAGDIRGIHGISGHPILIQASIDAVKQWKYRPFLINGKASEVETVVTVKFHK